MGHRLTKIYTRTGDDGTTGLADGSRVPKDAARVQAMGSIDETNSLIGMLVTELDAADPLASVLSAVQHDLFDLGGELSIPGATLVHVAHERALGVRKPSSGRSATRRRLGRDSRTSTS